MDRQPLSRAWPFLLLLLPACQQEERAEGHFDGPVAACVLQPEQGGPFEEPVGFVANSRSGRITPLDLKHGRILADDAAASFLRASYIATGRARVLGDIAVYAPDRETVTLFVADLSRDALLEVPYVLGVADTGVPQPVEVEPTATDPVFYDADRSGDHAELEDLRLRPGYTTTEDWLLEYDGEEWTVTGSRSGVQYEKARFGEPYHTGYRELEFTLRGTATAGDTIELSTDTGIVEHPVGGAVQGLALAPDQSALALAVFDRGTGSAALELFDPGAGVLLGAVPLPEGSQPSRLQWDEQGLWVADASLPRAYRVQVELSEPEASAVEEIDVGAPLVDLAHLRTEGGDRLVVAHVGVDSVSVYDLDERAWVAPDPLLPDQADVLHLGSLVTGMAAAPLPILSLEETEWGARVERYGVVVSLFDGRLVIVDPDTGCLFPDEKGPRSDEGSSESFYFDDVGPESDPSLLEDEATGRHLSVNRCPGVARSESWDVVFDAARQAWTVEGSRSGVQEGLAYSDQRYVNDDGAISFTIMSGALPATDGDRFHFTVDDGVLAFSGDYDRDGDREHSVELPGRPCTFWYDAGPTGGGWDQLDRRVFALWPIENSDLVLRARLASGDVEVGWD